MCEARAARGCSPKKPIAKNSLKRRGCSRVSIYSSYFFIRIMNNFGLLFEYSNNIRIFILLNKLPILAQNFKKKKMVEITEYHVLGLFCTQKGQQISKLDFGMFFGMFFGKIVRKFYMVY
jgi:hypothetical protein